MDGFGKQLGKIEKCWFGKGGYDDAMIGVTFQLTTALGSVIDFWGTWSTRSEGAQWTEKDRLIMLGDTVLRVNTLLTLCKVKEFSDLIGKPVEVEFEGDGKLHSWRILTEVL